MTDDAAALPLGLSPCAPGILRLRIGVGTRRAASYLPERDWPPPSGPEPVIARLEPDARHLAVSDDHGRPWFRMTLPVPRPGGRLRLRFELAGEQHLYGLGHGGGGLDRLGVTRRLWNCHVNHGPGSDIAVPLLLSSRGYGLFFDDPSAALLDPGDSQDALGFDYLSEAAALDVYLLAGGSLRATLELLARLLGQPLLPPRFAFGYLQSTRHVADRAELRRLMATFREKDLPCEALILLSSYGEALGWNRGVGHLEAQPALYADAADLLADAKAAGFRVILHEYPVLHRHSPLHAEAEQRGYLLDTAYPTLPAAERVPTSYHDGQRYLDFFNPAAGAWWWDRHRALVEAGVDGWWLDGGEGPSFADAGPDDRHNRYDLMRQAAFAAGEAKDRPRRRPFLLCRSGGPGMQRFGAACWSGDVNATFASLEAQIALGLGIGLSGVPWWGTDVGGYYPVEEESAELFARWFQFGGFCPIFRAHGRRWRDRLPWSHGPEIEAICRRYLELRYRLMPYTYSLARQAHQHGLPLMRPLVLNYPDDPRVLDLASPYLWGDDLLVAPVTRAAARRWPVYLPAGRWHDFWTGEVHEGRRSVEVPAPLERLPLFVRGGAILPLAVAPAGAIELRIYPEGHSRCELYDDDGATTDYLGGGFALTRIDCDAAPDAITCRIAAPEGDPSLVPAGRSYRLRFRVPSPPAAVAVDGRAAPASFEQGEDGAWLDVALARRQAEVRLRW